MILHPLQSRYTIIQLLMVVIISLMVQLRVVQNHTPQDHAMT